MNSSSVRTTLLVELTELLQLLHRIRLRLWLWLSVRRLRLGLVGRRTLFGPALRLTAADTI